MDEVAKIRIKAGDHEFEAEGPAHVVAAQFDFWKQLVSATSGLAPAARGVGQDVPKKRAQDTARRTTAAHLSFADPSGGHMRLFKIDKKRNALVLRAQPTGSERLADVALLVVYGYAKLASLEDVPVMRMNESIKASGVVMEKRLDRVTAPHVAAEYMVRSGKGKGGKYRLTPSGMAKAESIARQLASTVN